MAWRAVATANSAPAAAAPVWAAGCLSMQGPSRFPTWFLAPTLRLAATGRRGTGSRRLVAGVTRSFLSLTREIVRISKEAVSLEGPEALVEVVTAAGQPPRPALFLGEW